MREYFSNQEKFIGESEKKEALKDFLGKRVKDFSKTGLGYFCIIFEDDTMLAFNDDPKYQAVVEDVTDKYRGYEEE